MRKKTTTRTHAHERVVQRLWNPRSIQKLASDLATISCDALTEQTGGLVRPPGSDQIARRILRKDGRSLPTLVRAVQKASLHLSHPRYIAQQVAAPIPAAALVESVVAALNQSLAVWEMSPIATPIDRDLMARFKKAFGYPRDANGSLVPGGAFANLTALLAARDALCAGASKTGKARIAVIVGFQTHYSLSRAAGILGLGTDAVFPVPLDRDFSTDVTRVPEVFTAARGAGFRKFILVGTAGSTPTGSFDDLVALRDAATKEGAWFHVDAAHGGGLAFSSLQRWRLKGIGLAHSITFDPHKMMFMPLSAGGVLVRDGAHLATPLKEQAPYLFGSKRAWPDIGQFTIGCSQRFDALKVWLVWRAYGPQVWDALTTRVCDACHAAFRYCSQSDVLEPAHESQSNIFCFRLRRRGSAVAYDRLHWTIKETLNESGFAYISSAVLDGRRVLRLSVMNPRTSLADIYATLGRIESIAKTLIKRTENKREFMRSATSRT